MINNSQPAQSAHRINLKTVNGSLLVVMALMFGAYLVGINGLAISGFTMADHRNKLEELKRENKNLEVRISTVSSYGYLSEKIKNLNLVDVGEIKYINSANQVIAKR